MINRFSSRIQKLDASFLNEKLAFAKSYDRIAGYFSSSVFEVAGEAIENIEGKARIICNSHLSIEDVKTAALAAMQIRREWCEDKPEEKYSSPESHARLSKLYNLLKSGKLTARVIPDEAYGLIHGKAGVITLKNGKETSFIGSINETGSAYRSNYEIVWEDDSPEAIKWVRDEFEYFWNSPYAVDLCDFVIDDIGRISSRKVVSIDKWREKPEDSIPSAAVESPLYRKESGLWEHQKYFIERAFSDHIKYGGARFILADEVGLGKTIQLAMSALLIALSGEKPVLIIVPKTLMRQWQEELKNALDMPSAIYTGKGWEDENGIFYPYPLLKCPRRTAIVSQGLIINSTQSSELLKKEYECVIIDEAHRARRKNPNKDADNNKPDPNNLLDFIQQISIKTKSLLLATATPVQINTIEAFDLINALGLPKEHFRVAGNMLSKWRNKPQNMLNIICGKMPAPDAGTAEMWDIMRNPFPENRENKPRFKILKDKIKEHLEGADDTILPQEIYWGAEQNIKDRIEKLYIDDDFIKKYNPYIRHIIRRTRKYLENTINKTTNLPYMKKINVKLSGENDEEALPLEGPLRQAYALAEEFCQTLSKRVKSGGFMATLILRRIGSTITAGYNTAQKLLSWTEKGRKILKDEFNISLNDNADFEEEEDSDENSGSDIKNLSNEEIEILKVLYKRLSNNINDDPKYQKVVEILNGGTEEGRFPWKERGCIIFSQYYASAKYIGEKLSADMKDTPIALYGGGDKSRLFINGVEEKIGREEIKKLVREHKIKILVGTDAASEGLNLQTLSTLINLDLPWNPTRLEQRKGRIQRIGQTADNIYLYNMRYKDSVEDKVHRALSSRLNNIYALFGQIPDTLEDIWINIALGRKEEAEKRLDEIPESNPFEEIYEKTPPQTENWEMCSAVLDKEDKRKYMSQGW